MIEKLNKIKDESLRDGKGVIVHTDNFNWIVEQAEKTEKLEKENLLLYGRLNNIVALVREKL